MSKTYKPKGSPSPEERAYRIITYIGLDAGIKDAVRNISEVIKEGNIERSVYYYEVLYHLTVLKIGKQ